MDSPIEVKVRYTAEDLLLADKYRLHFNCRPVVRFALFVMACVFICVGITAFQKKGFDPMGFLIGASGVYWLLRPLERRWTMRRHVSKHPEKCECEWRFTDERVFGSTNSGRWDLSWDLFTKAAQTPQGFLFAGEGSPYYWLPLRGFASPEQAERFARLVKSKIKNFKFLK